MSNKPYITVISPVFNAEKIVNELVKRIEVVLNKITDNYEIILVEDFSKDNSWLEIEKIATKNNKIKGIKFSRNFGQHFAVSAGIKQANGQNIIILDCDLQDNPKYIENLISKRKEGFEIVFTKRIKRKHNPIKSFNAFIYNKLFAFFSDKSYDINAGSMVLVSENVANQFRLLKDKDRLYLQLFKWVGFNSTYIDVIHDKRYEGKTNYNFLKLMKIALQGWTSHSVKLLLMSIYAGIALSLLSFLTGVYIIFQYFLGGFQPGWPSIIVTILFSTGLILMSIGIVGIYIGKIFEQTKDRPLYIIEKKINL